MTPNVSVTWVPERFESGRGASGYGRRRWPNGKVAWSNPTFESVAILVFDVLDDRLMDEGLVGMKIHFTNLFSSGSRKPRLAFNERQAPASLPTLRASLRQLPTSCR